MEIVTTIKPNYYFTCPFCNGSEHNYTHLTTDKKPSHFGPWYCDKCGNCISGKVLKDNTIKMCKKHKKTLDKTLVLLKFAAETVDPKDTFYIIIKGNRYDKESMEERNEHDKYYYEEYTCAVNFLRFPTIFRGDTDYHGIFEHVKSIPFPTPIELQQLGSGITTDFSDVHWDMTGLYAEGINKLFDLSEEDRINES